MNESGERILFVTGKLAEPALRRVLESMGPKAGFIPEIRVLNITVAALLTTNWVARHLSISEEIDRVILPGLCRGELSEVENAIGKPTSRGPHDLRDLPEFFGRAKLQPPSLSEYDIEIIAEINHAPSKSSDELLAEARKLVGDGANIIDLGCSPGQIWESIGDAIRSLRDQGIRVSVDSFNAREVALAVEAGAELVLSVNSTNLNSAQSLCHDFPHVGFVAIPDTPNDLPSLIRTASELANSNVKFRLDPILEPIGFGFAASLGRYLEVRKIFPNAEIMMGVGNLTELTEVDSAGINLMLAGFCQEVGIRSILTTQVINWSRSAVKEFEIARRMVFHSIREQVIPKRLTSDLVMLRDPRLRAHGEAGLQDIAERITDRNFRLFAERDELHILSRGLYLRGTDPFDLFAQLLKTEPTIESSHAFYLGYEFAKAVTALTLGKNYTQDQALQWGVLTIPEIAHR